MRGIDPSTETTASRTCLSDDLVEQNFIANRRTLIRQAERVNGRDRTSIRLDDATVAVA